VYHPNGPTFFELARQALSSTDRGYDLLAPKFEYTPFRTPDSVLAAVSSRLGAPRSIDRALDVCCGTGAGVRFLRPLCRESVTGIDRSAGMLEEARCRLAEAPGVASVALVRGDALQMPFNGAFDLATCFGALGHILPGDTSAFVAAVRRTLRVGGRFAFVTSELPQVLSLRWLRARAFNALMHLRNALWRPPFIMYYLTFTLPAIRGTLAAEGYAVEEHAGLFPPPFGRHRLVVATRLKGPAPRTANAAGAPS
jgi:SAM-dependent methyltransferase